MGPRGTFSRFCAGTLTRAKGRGSAGPWTEQPGLGRHDSKALVSADLAWPKTCNPSAGLTGHLEGGGRGPGSTQEREEAETMKAGYDLLMKFIVIGDTSK